MPRFGLGRGRGDEFRRRTAHTIVARPTRFRGSGQKIARLRSHGRLPRKVWRLAGFFRCRRTAGLNRRARIATGALVTASSMDFMEAIEIVVAVIAGVPALAGITSYAEHEHIVPLCRWHAGGQRCSAKAAMSCRPDEWQLIIILRQQFAVQGILVWRSRFCKARVRLPIAVVRFILGAACPR